MIVMITIIMIITIILLCACSYCSTTKPSVIGSVHAVIHV